MDDGLVERLEFVENDSHDSSPSAGGFGDLSVGERPVAGAGFNDPGDPSRVATDGTDSEAFRAEIAEQIPNPGAPTGDDDSSPVGSAAQDTQPTGGAPSTPSVGWAHTAADAWLSANGWRRESEGVAGWMWVNDTLSARVGVVRNLDVDGPARTGLVARLAAIHDRDAARIRSELQALVPPTA